jgi:type III restriction enzyme
MSSETRELIRLCEQLPDAARAEVADFARFLLSKREGGPAARTPGGGDICHTDGVVGGSARVRNTRIPVWTLVQLKQLGRTDAELLTDYPGLTGDDLDAVWDYYRGHTAEIEQAIADEAGED